MLIDSHAHLDMGKYEGDIDEVLDRALMGGVTNIITVGIDYKSSIKAMDLAQQHDFIFSSIGYAHYSAGDIDIDKLMEISLLAKESKVVAWGEIGLDYFHMHSERERQIELFENQLDMAMDADLPVIIHDREAHEDVYEILKAKQKGNLKGVIHCFSGDYKLAMDFIGLGFYISIPGTVTFKNAIQIQDVARRIPIDKMIVETDSPYLSPVPKRGKRNEPLFVTHTAEKIARLRNVEFTEIAKNTTDNTKILFKLP